MYDHTLHRGRKMFCRYCLQTFSTAEILKICVNYCFNFDGKQMIKTLKKCEYVRLKGYERKIKSSFMIYGNFESILVIKDKGMLSLIRTNIKKLLLAVMALN